MRDYYHVYLSVSQYGDKYRAELFTEDLGGTDGDLLPMQWHGVDEWSPFLEASAPATPADGAERLGEDLFRQLLGNPANRAKWAEVVRKAADRKQVLRLLVDSCIPDEATERDHDKIHSLPYGLLRDKDGGYYLFRPREANQRRPEIQFVRVLRRSTPRPLRLERKPLRVLLAAAEPRDPALRFDCAGHLTRPARALDQARTPAQERAFEVRVCTRDGVKPVGDLLGASAAGQAPDEFHAAYCRTTRQGLETALRGSDFDLFHLLGHGSGGAVVLCCERCADDGAMCRADTVALGM
jgi:hypothetical protein